MEGQQCIWIGSMNGQNRYCPQFPQALRYLLRLFIHQVTWHPAWEAGNESPGKESERTMRHTVEFLPTVLHGGTSETRLCCQVYDTLMVAQDRTNVNKTGPPDGARLVSPVLKHGVLRRGLTVILPPYRSRPPPRRSVSRQNRNTWPCC
jgi:hypothetical protein